MLVSRNYFQFYVLILKVGMCIAVLYNFYSSFEFGIEVTNNWLFSPFPTIVFLGPEKKKKMSCHVFFSGLKLILIKLCKSQYRVQLWSFYKITTQKHKEK